MNHRPLKSESTVTVSVADTVANDAKELRMSTRPIWRGTLLIAVLGIAAWLLVRSSVKPGVDETVAGSALTEVSSDDDGANAIPVEIIRAGSIHPPTLSPSFAGMLNARQDSVLSFERGGRIVSIAVEEGDEVQQGDVLAQLDVSGIDASETRIRAELAAAEAVLQERLAGPRPQTIDTAKALVEQLEARVALANADMKRQRRLTASGAGSTQELDAANFGHQAMVRQLEAAQSELRLLQAGTRQEQIQSQRATRDAISAKLAELKSLRDDSVIVAPFDGRIAARNVDPGVVVGSGAGCLRILSVELEGRFGIPPMTAQSLAIGDGVDVSASNVRCRGKVIRMEPLVDQATRTRAIYVAVEPNAAWVSGQVASIHLPLRTDDSSDKTTDPNPSFWVPSTALSRGGRGVWTLLTMPGEQPTQTATRRAVEVLRTDGSVSLVTGMIQKQDRIIASGTHRITAGMKVQEQPVQEQSVQASSRVDVKLSDNPW